MQASGMSQGPSPTGRWRLRDADDSGTFFCFVPTKDRIWPVPNTANRQRMTSAVRGVRYSRLVRMRRRS